MKKLFVCLVMASVSILAEAAATVQTATLKDLQTVGSTTKKQKKQQYDLIIDTPTTEYTCRSKLGSKVKPTEFVVGSSIQFKLNGQNGEASNAMNNRIKCEIVRVGAVSAAQ